jgi:hypothetical protein
VTGISGQVRLRGAWDWGFGGKVFIRNEGAPTHSIKGLELVCINLCIIRLDRATRILTSTIKPH